MTKSLFKVTAWEKASLSRRLLCAFGRVSVLVVLVAAIGCAVYVKRYWIEAKVWHWRHGNWATVGSYTIPVPDGWLCLNWDSKGITLEKISGPKRPADGKFHMVPIISVDVARPLEPYGKATGTELWLAAERKRLAEERVESVEEKTMKFANESITCIGGKEFAALMRDRPTDPKTDALMKNCMSERGLDIMFMGEPADVVPFYSFISQIQRNR